MTWTPYDQYGIPNPLPRRPLTPQEQGALHNAPSYAGASGTVQPAAPQDPVVAPPSYGLWPVEQTREPPKPKQRPRRTTVPSLITNMDDEPVLPPSSEMSLNESQNHDAWKQGNGERVVGNGGLSCGLSTGGLMANREPMRWDYQTQRNAPIDDEPIVPPLSY